MGGGGGRESANGGGGGIVGMNLKCERRERK